ncbi:hypothetical protein [Brachybacterium sp. AOP29-B2-41]|uniref:hypothetical protein n=1 Tax=Brachybacterium sp. AOP29-B2-41 TaxID=3457704 RepID=UPI004033807A
MLAGAPSSGCPQHSLAGDVLADHPVGISRTSSCRPALGRSVPDQWPVGIAVPDGRSVGIAIPDGRALGDRVERSRGSHR